MRLEARSSEGRELTRRVRLRPAVVEVWRYRELFRNLVRWGLKVKYERSILGFLWTFLNPLLMVVILSVVFTYVVRIEIRNYWAFLLSGYFVWNIIGQSLIGATTVLSDHGNLRKSVRFPSEILLFSGITARLVELAVEVLILCAVLATLHHGGLPGSFLVVPVLFVPLLLITIGFALPLAVLAAFYRDVEQVIPIVVTAFFYVTPVFYPIEIVPEALRAWLWLNPFAPILSLFQDALYWGRVPPLAGLVGSFGLGLVVFLIGYAVFNRYKAVTAEIV